MRLDDLTYTLPPELIAQVPSDQRDECKMLVYDRTSGQRGHRHFKDIVSLLRAGDVLVVNTTKVWKARIYGKRPTGGNVEILVLERVRPGRFEVLLQPSGRVKDGEFLDIGDAGRRIQAQVHKKKHGIFLDIDEGSVDYLHQQRLSDVPLPPYIKRQTDDGDESAYQTVYAREEGSIAAPTAGFHFTRELLERIRMKGVQIVEVVLHIGYGTFRLISAAEIEAHIMLPEYSLLTEEAAVALNQALSEERRIIAVGTSVTRVLESAYSREVHKVLPYEGYTELFIRPGYRFKVVGALVTNFHLPKTSLLALVYAFAGKEAVQSLYQDAIEHHYRFYSYGDAMFLF